MNDPQCITCKDVMSHVCESLGEELNSPRCIAIKEHLENCTHCQNYFNSVEQTIEFYRSYNVIMPEEAHERLFKLLNLDEPSEGDTSR